MQAEYTYNIRIELPSRKAEETQSYCHNISGKK
jgi:hypothetical protein